MELSFSEIVGMKLYKLYENTKYYSMIIRLEIDNFVNKLL